MIAVMLILAGCNVGLFVLCMSYRRLLLESVRASQEALAMLSEDEEQHP